ncbi:unnamed protein product [Leuciscus chuanchicus]
MLKCLQVLHDEKIIHADLKPENILVIDEEHSDIKVADFGCGCYEDEQVFSYMGTRWYRAPELMLRQPYSTAISNKWKHKTVAKSSAIRHPKCRPLASIQGATNHAFLDFVRRCLTYVHWDPKMRMTPQEAMQHKWILEGRRYNHHRTHDHLRHEPMDSTAEPPLPNPRSGPLRKGGHKAFCEERLAHL